jgi:hypothetical protein
VQAAEGHVAAKPAVVVSHQLVGAVGGGDVDRHHHQVRPVVGGQRRHRELRLRDVLGASSAGDADQRLKACQAMLEDYTQRVFRAVGGP